MFIRSGYSAQTRSTRSGTEHRHRRPDVLVAFGDADRRLGAQPVRGRLGLEPGDVEAVELDDVGARAARAARGDDRPDALDRGPVAAVADGDGRTGVDDAVDLGLVRRRWHVVLGVEGVQRI